MQVLKKLGVAGGALAVAVVSIALAATPANADTGAQPGDAVGVGSDTVQNAADFVFDGAPGVAGAYNSNGNVNRVDNVFATGDANGRTLYDGTCGAAGSTGLGGFCSATNAGAPNVLTPSVILRAGTRPVTRPNGSGQGVNALITDANAGYKGLPTGSISYARMSRLPNATEINNCGQASNCGSLHVYQFADDNLGIARVSSGFNGPAGLSADTLYKIFVSCSIKTWSQVPGYTGSAGSNTIHPLLPPTTSGTASFFLTDLNVAEGNAATPATPGSCIRTVQEHDPTGIYADPSPADAIEPFSQGKLSLINKSYYVNGVSYSGTGAANGAFTPNFLKLEDGAVTTGQTGANYSSTRGLYFVVRQPDVNSSTAFQPGGSLNFVQALFSDSQSAIRSNIGKTQITQAGFTPDYTDCGLNGVNC